MGRKQPLNQHFLQDSVSKEMELKNPTLFLDFAHWDLGLLKKNIYAQKTNFIASFSSGSRCHLRNGIQTICKHQTRRVCCVQVWTMYLLPEERKAMWKLCPTRQFLLLVSQSLSPHLWQSVSPPSSDLGGFFVLIQAAEVILLRFISHSLFHGFRRRSSIG